jgi:hypothetical protein
MPAYQEKIGGKAATSRDSIRCAKVEISGTAITELDSDRVVIAIPRERIQQIKLLYDTRVKNPFCQFFFGYTLLLSGLIGLIVFFVAASAGGDLLIQTANGVEVIAEAGNLVLPLIPITLWLMCGIGFWSLFGIFQYRYHFLIDSENRKHKIFFEKTIDIKEIKQFIRIAHLHFGCEIDVSAIEKMQAFMIHNESGKWGKNIPAYQEEQSAAKKVVTLLLGSCLDLVNMVLLPFRSVATIVAMIGRKVKGGLTSMGSHLVSFGWRPLEAYLTGKKKRK